MNLGEDRVKQGNEVQESRTTSYRRLTDILPMEIEIDPKRTGVKASLIPVTFPPVYYSEKNRLCGPFGAFLDRDPPNSPDSWILCCPGCGEAGSPREGQHWQATQGSFDDVTTLTLEPSIAKSCCGWHGYLEKGQFVQQRSEASAVLGTVGDD